MFYYIQAKWKKGLKTQFASGEFKKGVKQKNDEGEFEKQCFKRKITYGELKRPQQFFGPAAEKIARPKWRVALALRDC